MPLPGGVGTIANAPDQSVNMTAQPLILSEGFRYE